MKSRAVRLIALVSILGPGLIAANAGNDAGGIATYASAGSQFGYRMLFVMLLVTVALVIVQEMSARLGAVTGEGLVSLFREQFPLRWAAFAVLCLMVANLGLVVSEFAGIGAAFELLGVSRYLAVPISALLLWGLIVFGSYRYSERAFLVLTLAFVSYPIAAVLAHPHWSEVGSNLLLPHMQANSAFMLLTVALIGTTITPYMQLFQAAGVADKGASGDSLRAIRLDAIVGSIAANIVSIFIIVATAATIGGTGPLASAADAAEALRPVAGANASLLFGIGLLGASALAAAVVPLSTSYAVCEAIGVERSVSSSFRQAPLFMGLFTAQIAIGAGLALLPGNLIALLLHMQVLNGLITPIILAFILIVANRRSVLGEHANGPIVRVVAAVCVSVVGVLAIVVALQSVVGWFS